MKTTRSPSAESAKTGLAKTFQVLSKTPNEAAVAILVAALDSPDPVIQEGALWALLDRRSPGGQREILKRLHRDAQRWRPIIDQRQGSLTHALRDAVLGTDVQLCQNACQAIIWFKEYDLLPALIVAAEDRLHSNVDVAARTIVELAELLSAAMSSLSTTDRRDLQMIRRRVSGLLDVSVSRYMKHTRREIITAFLLLSQRDNVVLKQILQDPHHPAYLPLIDDLFHDPHSGIVRLLLGFLDDPRAPSCAISALMRRNDLKFIRSLLRKIGFTPSAAATVNLKRVDSIGWLGHDDKLIDQLNDAEQHSLVQLILTSSMKRLEAFKTIDYLVRYGKPGGRLAAAAALAQFGGAEANALALVALESGDPTMQAAVVPQLRQRGIPGALSRLVEQLDSPHEVVRQAARKALAEFSVERFLAAYDLLDDDVRRTTGALVRKIDPGALNTLAEELKSPSRTRRLRALGVASAAEVIVELEPRVLKLLTDNDHVVRTEAARVLVACDTPASRRALREALLDRSVTVQEAAECSLRQLAVGGARREEQTA
jgi:HEAT repeat protein